MRGGGARGDRRAGPGTQGLSHHPSQGAGQAGGWQEQPHSGYRDWRPPWGWGQAEAGWDSRGPAGSSWGLGGAVQARSWDLALASERPEALYGAAQGQLSGRGGLAVAQLC